MTWARAALLVAVLAMGAAHVLQPHLDPWHEPVSFYVHGAGGPWFTLALAAFSFASLLVARSHRTRASMPWLLGFGAGMLLAALIPADPYFPWQEQPTWSGAIHATAAVVAPPLLWVPMWCRVRPAATPRAGGEWAFFLAYSAGLAACGSSLLVGWVRDAPPPLIGVAERALAVAAVGWLWRVARPPRIR